MRPMGKKKSGTSKDVLLFFEVMGLMGRIGQMGQMGNHTICGRRTSR